MLARAEFDALAAGAGSAHGALRDGQLSKRVLLLRIVADTAIERAPNLRTRLRDALALLSAVQRGAPETAAQVLLSPHVGAWAMHSLRRLRGIGAAETPIEEDLGYLMGIAAAAAIRARLDFELTVHADRHGVMLPTLGMIKVPGGARRLCGRHRAGSGGFELDGVGTIPVLDPNGPQTDLWHPLRRLTSAVGEQRISVVLDDLDPFRDQSLPVTGRLTRAEVKNWQARLDEGWALLVRDHRARAESIAQAAVTLVPLVATDSAPELSASSSDAFGAVCLTYPTDGLTMAGALVHEFQHAKLSALLDLVPLHVRSNPRLFYAPWRGDPRPLRGLFQGAYAYLGLSDFWHAHRLTRVEDGAPLAQFEFARWREQVWRTLPTLEASGDLTPDGVRFVGGMRRTLAELRRAQVPARPAALARTASADHRITWRLRNLIPDPQAVADWADAWLAGQARPTTRAAPSTMIPSQPAFHSTGRTKLAHLWVTDPNRFDRLRGDPARLAAAAAPATTADALYVRGDVPAAARAYRDEIVRDPERTSSWVGLALAHQDPALTASPEVVFALGREIAHRSGAGPDPVRLAAWLAGVETGTASVF